jgi:hypothetical protein
MHTFGEGLAPGGALKTWSLVTGLFKATVSAGRRDLRVRDDNP